MRRKFSTYYVFEVQQNIFIVTCDTFDILDVCKGHLLVHLADTEGSNTLPGNLNSATDSFKKLVCGIENFAELLNLYILVPNLRL